MRILYLCPDYGIPVLGRKGAAVHVREMMSAFARAGHSVILAAPVASKSPWEEPARLDGQFLHLPASESVQNLFHGLMDYVHLLEVSSPVPGTLRRVLYDQELESQLLRRFHSHPPDLIYLRAAVYSTAGVRLAREWNRPLMVELNAPLAAEQAAYRSDGLDELALRAERRLLSHADAVLAVSEVLRRHAIRLGAAPERVHLLPNGINPAMFFPAAPDPSVRERWGLDGARVIGFVGGLRPWHGVRDLPLLFARLAAGDGKLRLVLVGDGPLRGEIEQRLGELDLAKRAVFTGALAHEAVAGLIRQFDVAIAPYPRLDHEFYFSPLKLFEYMACGVPVVAADTGQIAEVLRDGETGLLYSPGDLDSLTGACQRLLANPALGRRLGEAAAREVHGRYTWDHNARRALDLARGLGSGS